MCGCGTLQWASWKRALRNGYGVLRSSLSWPAGGKLAVSGGAERLWRTVPAASGNGVWTGGCRGRGKGRGTRRDRLEDRQAARQDDDDAAGETRQEPWSAARASFVGRYVARGRIFSQGQRAAGVVSHARTRYQGHVQHLSSTRLAPVHSSTRLAVWLRCCRRRRPWPVRLAAEARHASLPPMHPIHSRPFPSMTIAPRHARRHTTLSALTRRGR